MIVFALAAVTGLLAASLLPGSLVAANPQGVDEPYALTPASAEPVGPRLAFSAVPRYPAKSSMLFVTIREPRMSLLDWFVLRPEEHKAVDFLTHDQKYGTQTPSQQNQLNAQMMRSAKQTAEYVALTKLGYPTTVTEGDVIIQAIVCLEGNPDGSCKTRAPAASVLQPGDAMREVDGVKIGTVEDLAAVLVKHKPGDVVTVGYERPGTGAGSGKGSGPVTLIASGDGTNRTIIGFQPVDTRTTKVPFDVSIDSGAIGGPSAGLAFTLTLLDELTPGELTGGLPVAVTGTIELDGHVGAIGGLFAKTAAVKQMGAKVFLVPEDQGPEDIARARAVAGSDLQIVPVATIDDALAALAKFGGNGLQLGTPGKDYKAAA
jgi:PDZ domain-containing protein